jgi:Flp pilus assembly protein TadD
MRSYVASRQPQARSFRFARRFSLATLGLSLALVCGCTPHGPRELLQGKKLLEHGKYPQARQKLLEATDLLKTNAHAWNYLGVASQHAGEPVEAEKAYQRALLIDHDLTEAHFNLGCLYLEQRRPAAAKSEFTAFSLRRGNSLEGLLMLGLAELRNHEGAAAEKSFSEALRLSPEHAEALNGLGLSRLQRGKPAEALATFRSAFKAQPQYSPALFNAGIVEHEYFKDQRGALETFRQYLALKPGAADAAAAREEIRLLETELNPPKPVSVTAPATNPPSLQPAAAVNRTTQTIPPSIAAANAINHYVYRNPPRPAPGNRTLAQKFFLQGSQAQQAKRTGDAVTAYRGAVQADPSHFEAWFNLALIAAESGSFSDGLAAYEHALAIEPDSANARYNFALLLRQANCPIEAANELEKLLAHSPNEPRAHLVLGSLYAGQLQDTARARQHYQKLLEVDPRNLQAMTVRSWLSNHPN